MRYGYETCSLILREEHRLEVFEKWALRSIFGCKKIEIQEAGECCMMRSFIIFTDHHILLGTSY
jgi:hypothetical protein